MHGNSTGFASPDMFTFDDFTSYQCRGSFSFWNKWIKSLISWRISLYTFYLRCVQPDSAWRRSWRAFFSSVSVEISCSYYQAVQRIPYHWVWGMFSYVVILILNSKFNGYLKTNLNISSKEDWYILGVIGGWTF